MCELFNSNKNHGFSSRRAKTKEEQRAEMIRNRLSWESAKCKIREREAKCGTSSNPAYAEDHWCDEHVPK